MTFARLNTTAGIPLRYANRHGLISGATGTGKTVTLMKLAEEFSKAGVPVFLADVKGDIAALSRSCPAELLDLFGRNGRQICLPLHAMGADLVARALELTDAQSGVVEAAFGLWAHGVAPLDSPADFRAMLQYMLARKAELAGSYGQVTAASTGVVVRALNRLERQAGPHFFQGAAFDVADLLQERDGKGVLSIIAADQLIQAPRLYGAFLLYVLNDLYARLPEVGDLERPRLVLFFDEAHLLFQDCPPSLLRKIEQTVRLIRSKGVGVYFASQSAADIPRVIAAQLAHTIEHDRSMPVGTARVSTMDQSGRPYDAGLQRIDKPDCPLGALSRQERPRVEPVQPVSAPRVSSPAYKLGKLVAFGLATGWIASTAALGWQFVQPGAPISIPLLFAWGALTAALAKSDRLFN